MHARRTFAIALSLLLSAPPAFAAELGTRPIRMIVPYSAGGTADVLPRILAEKMRSQFPAGVIVENKPGGGGNIGAELVAQSEPDGHTLLVSPPGPIAINRSLYPKLGYQAEHWVPVTVIAAVPNVLAVSSKVAARTVPELIAYLAANPDKVTFASQGNGSTSHLTAMLFQSITGTKIIHVPYRGTAPALTDLAGGQVDLFFDNLSSSARLHQSGRIRVLGVADDKRSPVLPDVPTFAEAGVPAMQSVTWFAVVAPRGTPDPVVQQLNRALVGALNLPDVRAQFAEQGAEVVGNRPDQMGAFVRDETARWAKVIAEAGVTVD